MKGGNLDFTFDMGDLDREKVLIEAAEELDVLRGHLGGDESGKTPEGDMIRDFAGERAEFAAFPIAYRITDQDFLTHKSGPPVRFKELSKKYDFYWISFPIMLWPKRNWAFHRLEAKVEFNPEGTAAHARPKAYQIFPEKRFQTLLAVRNHLEIGIDENFQFSADTGVLSGQLGVPQGFPQADVDANLTADMEVVAGPFEYRIKRARIDHSSTGIEEIFWRLDGAQFFQGDDFKLIAIIQVPKETEEVNIIGKMQAYRRFNLLSADLRDAIAELLTSTYKTFFRSGMPIGDKKSWNNVTRNA